jgi:hypothetical protein
MSHPDFRVTQINAVFPANGTPGELEKALQKMCADADKAILDYTSNILLISDRNTDKNTAPIPTL